MLPTLTNNAAGGYQGPVKTKLLKGAGLNVYYQFISLLIYFFFFWQKPDIGVELTGGCQGFATKFMDWPEELLVGGVKKNSSNIIRRCAL